MRGRTVLFLVAILSSCFMGLGCDDASWSMAGDQPPATGVFVHIETGPDDPHTVLMALKMATMMSEDHDVLVYFDVKGIGVVTKDAPDLEHKPFPSSKTMLKTLIAKGVGVYACPGCLKALDKSSEDLMPGVQVAEKEAFFNFTRGRILTLDY